MANGIRDDSKREKAIEDYWQADLQTKQDVDVLNYRNDRLPTLNTRGISLTMAFSRLVLLAQYVIGTCYTFLSLGS